LLRTFPLLFAAVCLPLTLGSAPQKAHAAAYPPDTTATTLAAVPTAPALPGYLTPIAEPNGFGTQITRIADQTAFGTASTVVRHHYSKTQPWNSDGTRIMLSAALHPMLDGSYAIVRSSNTFTPSYTRWSCTDPNVLYKPDAGNEWRKITINPSNTTQTTTTLRTFTGYKNLVMGPNEANLSIDDRYVALSGQKTSGSPNGDADMWVIVYDIPNDVIRSVTPFYNKYGMTDWVSMSQSGAYVVIRWSASGSGTNQGVEAYTLPSTTGDPLVFGRQLTPDGSHADLGYDAAGNEVYVCADFVNSGVSVSSYRLDTGARVTQLSDGGVKAPFQAAHISCRNYKRPGWAYVGTQQANTLPPPNPLETDKELFAVKLDGSGTVERFGWTYNNYYNYNSEAHLVPNPDGTKVMFASNWGGGSSSSIVYSYVAEWAQTPAVNTYQAELATLGGGSYVETTNSGYNGTGYVNYQATSTVQFTNVAGLGGGGKTLTIRYANGGGSTRTGQVIVNGGTPVTINEPSTGSFATWSTISLPITLNDNSTNTISVNSTGSDLGNIDQITVTDGEPAFTTQPTSQTVTAGTTVNFTVAASGNPTPTYQWQKNGVNLTNGGNISGATSATLTLSSVTAGNAGSYVAIASSVSGLTTSNAATLTVNTPPSFTTQPSSQTVTAGANVTFTSATTGTPTITYQWKKNGTNISGATSASYSLTNVQTANNGNYTVVATNVAGSTTSSTATLTVNNLTYQAENATLSGGDVAESNVAGYNGTGFVNSSTTGGSMLFTNVNGQGGGTKTLIIRYALGKPDRTGQLVVNGGTPVSLLTADTGAFTNWVTISVTITLNNNSTNTIALNTNGADLGNIDEITIQ
jgi:hypothetical protein